ncbi:type II toxin-antitoxin system antitoxin, RelB/DinJ family [Allohahella marinimesophila]|uniref:Addiction module component n=1 Tax=Allohahella marinimesophila TaxID=1054972 RepID=A0ABP7QAX2_9GAMM
MAHTTVLHIDVDDRLKSDEAEKLASLDLTADQEAHDAWFRAKVEEAMADDRATVPQRQLMDEAQALIDRKRRG